MTNKYFKIFSLFLAIGFLFSTGTEAVQAKEKPFDYLRIFYSTEGPKARASFRSHLRSIDVIAPQVYTIDSEGDVKGKVRADTLSIARKNKIKVMPLFTNKGFSASNAQAFLDNETAQKKAIGLLVDEAVKNKFWGWQSDFEQIDASYRDKFSAFISNLNNELKKKNKILSVAVITQISDNPEDCATARHPDIWQTLVGVYDYKALASSTDFISLMSYDDPWSKGPVARYTWLKQVLGQALKSIPPEKLSLGIPLYYWQWNDTTGKLVGIGGYAGITKALNKHKTTIGYDETEACSYIRFTKKDGDHTIWYENAKSIKKKIDLIKEYKLHGFSAWAIGLEVPSVYKSM